MVATLVNPQNGNLAFKLFDFEGAGNFDHVQRNNYYSLIFVKQAAGTLKADFTSYGLEGNMVFAFSPYQPFMFASQATFVGFAIHFHPDFFCIHRHQQEVACNGVLFNNIYNPPFLHINEQQQQLLQAPIDQLKTEVQHTGLAQYELLVAHLKILLIHLSRIKTEQRAQETVTIADNGHSFVLQSLKDAIENSFRENHSASDYAQRLHISAKALARITKTHYNKTLTGLIADRIIIEAKRELYMTSKTIKEIAYQLGYDDEYYFSRFFKTNTDISPQLYRETVGFAAAER